MQNAFRLAALGVAIALSGCSDKPAFRFRDLSASATVESAKASGTVKDCPTQPTEQGEYWCSLTDGVIAGASATENYALFDRAGFQALVVDYESQSYPVVATKLTQAYGKPCRVEKATAQNAFGAQFENETSVWCFKEGELLLHRYNERLDQSRLMFYSHRPNPDRTPPQPPATPNSL